MSKTVTINVLPDERKGDRFDITPHFLTVSNKNSGEDLSLVLHLSGDSTAKPCFDIHPESNRAMARSVASSCSISSGF